MFISLTLIEQKILQMENHIKSALEKSCDYLNYRNIVSELLLQGKVTGNEQSEALLNYSNLNQTRMNRLDKTIVIPTENSVKLNSFQKKYIWLVLAEGWCGDAAQVLPVLNKMALTSNAIELKLVFRDENPELMDLFLTNGTKSIPKLIIIDKESLSVISHWGPRPKGALDLIANYKALHGVVDESAKAELQLWYLHDKGLSIQNEIINLMGF